MRQNSDISPVNSLDMEMSQSSLTGRRRSRAANNHSLANVFDQKHNDPAADDYHHHPHMQPQYDHGVLHQVPSWEKSYRSNISVGDIQEEDDSLIRVNSYDVKPELQNQHSHSSGQMMPPPAPVMNHHPPASDRSHHNQHLDESDDMDVGMDWEAPGE